MTRENDQLDGRRVWVELSDKGTSRLADYFDAWFPSSA